MLRRWYMLYYYLSRYMHSLKLWMMPQKHHVYQIWWLSFNRFWLTTLKSQQLYPLSTPWALGKKHSKNCICTSGCLNWKIVLNRFNARWILDLGHFGLLQWNFNTHLHLRYATSYRYITSTELTSPQYESLRKSSGSSSGGLQVSRSSLRDVTRHSRLPMTTR